MPSEKVLIVDDEKLVRWSLRQKCEEWGYRVLEADNGAAALKIAHNESPDLVLLDVRLPDASGIDILEQIKKAGDARAVIMITADPQLEDVKTALKLGAYDFVGKPLDFDELRSPSKTRWKPPACAPKSNRCAAKLRRRAGYHNVIGVSAKMADLLGFVSKVAASEATTILVQGESGTGKDLIAKAIHYQSRRQDKPFVAINCSAIPETLMEAELFGHERGAFTDAKAMKKGLFEMADGGTLFLDEIGELSPLLQAKLLRVLEDQVIRRVGGVRDMQVDVRVIAASNRDLERAVKRKHLPPGPVLPPGHHFALSAAPARPQRRHSAAGGVLHRPLQPQVPQVSRRHHRRHPQAADEIRLAGQCARAEKCRRARHDPRRRQRPPSGLPALCRGANSKPPTPRLKCHRAAAATTAAAPKPSFPTAAACPSSPFPRAAPRSKKSSAHWSKWPWRRPTATRPTPPACSTSAAMRCATS